MTNRSVRATVVASMLVAACGQASREPTSPPSGTAEPPATPGPSGSPGPTPAPAAPPEPPGVANTIGVSFMLDPRLQGGTYGGEVWLSPATYTGIVGQDAVEARAHGFDVSGAAMVISPEWIPSDPDMVTVSPPRGDRVTLTVARPGESRIEITAPGLLTKELVVRATASDGRIVQVEISQ